MPIVRSYSGTD